MRKERLLSLALAATLAASSVVFLFPAKKANAADKNIADQFNDAQVQAWAKAYVDGNDGSTKDGKLSTKEISNVKTINLNNYKVTDLKGLTIFTNTESFYMDNSNVKSLNVSAFTKLKTLSCENSGLSTITFGNNTALTQVDCDGNSLTSLNVSKLTSLSHLDCSNNALTSLTVTGCTKLVTISCNKNKLTSLNTSKLISLVFLDCSENSLSSLNASGCTKLETLNCKKNNLQNGNSYFNITSCSNLKTVDISNNNFNSISWGTRKYLTVLDCSSNKLTSITISGLTSLTNLDASNNKISTVDLSKNTKLKELVISTNTLTGLDLSKNTALQTLFCGNNYKIGKLDLSNNTELLNLSCRMCGLEELNISKLNKLQKLDCDSNNLKTIDFSNNKELATLSCCNNYLTSLNVTSLSKITSLACTNNELTSIDLSNNPLLDSLYCSNNLFTSIDLSKVTSLTHLYCSSNKLTSLDLSGLTKLNYVECYSNKLTNITMKDNSNLWVLNCNDNKLTSLKVPASIVFLVCNDNNFTELDIIDNPNIKKLVSTTEPTIISSGQVYQEYFSDILATVYLCVDDNMKFITVVPSNQNGDINPSGESGEQILGFVNRLYQYVLGRDPEPEGAAYWTTELYNFRKTGAEVAQGFIFSKEFTDKNTSNTDFVTILYKTFFGRDPETEGLNYWVGQLDSGSMSRQRVANGFIYSQEWADKCAEYGIRSGGDIKPSGDIKPTSLTYGFVERMYNKALGRDYDSEGREYWASQLANYNLTGGQLGIQFFLSDEMNKKGISNEEFVKRLYLTFMDREGETDGFNYWVGQLNGGASRSSVVYGFTRSAEFVEKCINARIMPY